MIINDLQNIFVFLFFFERKTSEKKLLFADFWKFLILTSCRHLFLFCATFSFFFKKTLRNVFFEKSVFPIFLFFDFFLNFCSPHPSP